ncbi:helix-turn-helix domain-containing protein, partial [Paenibacillus abyssi]
MKRRVMTGEGPQYDPEKVGEAIRQMRNLANLTLSALSGKIGIPQSKLSYIETGKYKKVHNKDIERIAAGLKCKVDSLLNQSTLKDNPQDEKIAMDIDTIRSYLLLARNKEVAAMIQKLEAEVNTESIY